MLALSGLSTIFTWGSICVAHIRFRKAWALKGFRTDQLVFKAQLGVAGSYLGFICSILVLAAQFWTSAWPVGYENENQAERFFLGCLAAPVVLIFYVSWKVWNKTSIVRASDMDITTGRRNLDAEELRATAKAEYKSLPGYRKIGAWLY